jgi:integrase
MSVRKRTWKGRDGEQREAWVCDYVDGQGQRHIETFARKADAIARHAKVAVDVAAGVHTPVNKSLTVKEAAEDWLRTVELEKRERSTVKQYREHVAHISKRLGGLTLAKLTTPRVSKFRDELLADFSRPTAKKILVSFKSILKDARRRGNVASNAADGVSIKADTRATKRLEVGVDIPLPDEIRRFVGAATGRWRPVLVVAAFAGLRASELRGLRWQDVDLKAGQLHVRQRADAWNVIGSPKSRAGTRTIPIGPFVVNVLKEWRLACPKGAAGLVFPNTQGGVENHSNILSRGYWPAQLAAGVCVPAVDGDGKPVLGKDGHPTMQAKYSGLHALRHFFASWCINRKADGGLELPLKVVQERLGHSSITITADTYGHLFPAKDDGGELAAAERLLLGLHSA